MDKLGVQLVGALVDHAFKASPIHYTDLDNTMLGKHAHRAIPRQPSFLPSASRPYPSSSFRRLRYPNRLLRDSARQTISYQTPRVICCRSRRVEAHAILPGSKSICDRMVHVSGAVVAHEAPAAPAVEKPSAPQPEQHVTENSKQDDATKALEETAADLNAGESAKAAEDAAFWAKAEQDAQRQLIAVASDEKRFYKEVEGSEGGYLLGGAPSNYFELLGIDEPPSTAKTIKKAYRRFQKIAHPDIAGETATQLNVLMNEAYPMLMDDELRTSYYEQAQALKESWGELGGFSGRPRSSWAGAERETKGIFVDESECIGCTLCWSLAPDTFGQDDESGRAQVHTQWGDDQIGIQTAVESCPVSCIYWVRRDQLPALEFAMSCCDQELIVSMMMRNAGSGSSKPAKHSPWDKAASY